MDGKIKNTCVHIVKGEVQVQLKFCKIVCNVVNFMNEVIIMYLWNKVSKKCIEFHGKRENYLKTLLITLNEYILLYGKDTLVLL